MSNGNTINDMNGPLTTDDAATGRALAIDAIMDRQEAEASDSFSLRVAEWLADCAQDSSYRENHALLAGFVSEMFEFLPKKAIEIG